MAVGGVEANFDLNHFPVSHSFITSILPALTKAISFSYCIFSPGAIFFHVNEFSCPV